jgi:hypothetical protein
MMKTLSPKIQFTVRQFRSKKKSACFVATFLLMQNFAFGNQENETQSKFYISANQKASAQVTVQTAMPKPVIPEKVKYTGSPAEIASRLAMLFDSTRKVISDNQKLINDPNLGDKNIGVQRVLEETLKIFATKASGGITGPYEENFIEAITAVIEDAQSVINEKGKGFKGFIPAVYGKRLTEVFNARMKGRAQLHLTAPKELVRNLTNLPDEWESNVIHSKFSSKEWKKGAPFVEIIELKGKKVFRSISPQYYVESCLSCHGKPLGNKDITGGTMEGASLGGCGRSPFSHFVPLIHILTFKNK